MPKSQIESTIADLGISLIAERTPALMDHYLGAEMVSSNEENTRVAALLGFQVGQELLYVPVLFLNGKIKGTEVLYLKNSDTFTSNSKQWVEFLTTKNPGIMGAGAQLLAAQHFQPCAYSGQAGPETRQTVWRGCR